MTNRLTLAAGSDFWNETGGHQDGGRLWCIRWEEDRRLDLTSEVEMWCVENLRQYEVRLEPPHGGWNIDTGSLVIEFDHPADMLIFRATWADA